MTALDRFDLEPPDSVAGRILAAAADCCDRWGSAKTTVDDIAKAAGLSRATLYRAFPGGRGAVFDALRRQQMVAFFLELDAGLRTATTLEEALTSGLHVASRLLADDLELARELETNPGEALQSFTSDGLGRIFSACHAFVSPHLQLWLPKIEADRVSELCARLVLTYFLEPGSGVDLTVESTARRIVGTRVLPGLAVRVPELSTT